MTRNGILHAMAACAIIADRAPTSSTAIMGHLEATGPYSAEHFNDMIRQANDGSINEFSEKRLCRWLGWMQGVLGARDLLTLEDVKEMNRFHKDD